MHGLTTSGVLFPDPSRPVTSPTAGCIEMSSSPTRHQLFIIAPSRVLNSVWAYRRSASRRGRVYARLAEEDGAWTLRCIHNWGEGSPLTHSCAALRQTVISRSQERVKQIALQTQAHRDMRSVSGCFVPVHCYPSMQEAWFDFRLGETFNGNNSLYLPPSLTLARSPWLYYISPRERIYPCWNMHHISFWFDTIRNLPGSLHEISILPAIHHIVISLAGIHLRNQRDFKHMVVTKRFIYLSRI